MDQASSPKRPAISASSAFEDLVGLAAFGLHQDRAAGLAASIIRPMIDVPPTVEPSRVTRTTASKPSTV
jgi:hypothetical protein